MTTKKFYNIDTGRVGRTPFSDPIDEDALLVEAVGKAEAEVLVHVVLEEGDLVDLDRNWR